MTLIFDLFIVLTNFLPLSRNGEKSENSVLWPWNSLGFVRLSRNMFMQNFIELSAAVTELSCVQRKRNLAEYNTVRRYRADSKNRKTNVSTAIPPAFTRKKSGEFGSTTVIFQLRNWFKLQFKLVLYLIICIIIVKVIEIAIISVIIKLSNFHLS